MVLADPMVDHLTTVLQAANDALAELRQSNARLDAYQQVMSPESAGSRLEQSTKLGLRL